MPARLGLAVSKKVSPLATQRNRLKRQIRESFREQTAASHVPAHPDIVNLGFVSEEHKISAMAGAEALIMPSPFESLSIATLEAWGLGIPALVNAECEVLKGQASRSGAGLTFTSAAEFEDGLRRLLASKEMRAELGEKGRRFVEENYRWESVERKLLDWKLE